MKSNHVCNVITAFALASFVSATIAVAQDSATANDSRSDTNLQADGESLADAVSRINAEVADRFGVLSPKVLTVPDVKRAIEAAVIEFNESDAEHRVAYVTALTQVLANERVPTSVRFIVMPIIGTYSQNQKNEFRDGRHVDISINYVLEVPHGTGSGRRAIGLSQIVEVFRITKPKEQEKPLVPPTKVSQPR